ncbi:MAG: prepilin-type N-terminal cleavage/methylation domain-containing protein [bacterium]|nr:prepilin-type N-terminal cleavage/methylation domain-containing protein [bacterium]
MFRSPVCTCSGRSRGFYKHCSKGSERAFTLIEVMIAVSVIAVLVAGLFMAVRGHRETMERQQCEANLLRIANAAESVRQNYIENVGEVRCWFDIGGAGVSTMPSSVIKFVADPLPILKCPADKTNNASYYFQINSHKHDSYGEGVRYNIYCIHGHMIDGKRKYLAIKREIMKSSQNADAAKLNVSPIKVEVVTQFSHNPTGYTAY